MKEIHQSETFKKKHSRQDSASSNYFLPWSCWASFGSFWRQRWPSTFLPGSPRIFFPEKHSPRPRALQTPQNSCESEGQSDQSPWNPILKQLGSSLRQLQSHFRQILEYEHLRCSTDIGLNKSFDTSHNSVVYFYCLIRVQAIAVSEIYGLIKS